MNNIISLMQRKPINTLLWIAKDILKRNPSEVYFEGDLWILKRLADIYTGDNKKLKDGLKS